MLERNPLRERLERGNVALGAVAKNPSPMLVEVYGNIGLDFAFIDLEHGGPSPFNSYHLEHLWRAARLGEIEPLVRIPSGDPPLVRRILDTGIRSLLIPRVKTADDVRAAVEASRFEYGDAPGERGFVSGCQANRWGRDLDGYLDRQDETVLVGVIIETVAAVDNLEEILSVPELGFAMIGHRDLTISLGHRSEVDHPEVQEVVERIRSACIDADVPVGKVPADPADTRAAIDDGFQFFLLGYELDAIREYFGEWVDDLDTARPSE